MAGMVAMLAQLWCVPELLARDFAEHMQTQARLREEIEARTRPDSDKTPIQRQSIAAAKLVGCAGVLAESDNEDRAADARLLRAQLDEGRRSFQLELASRRAQAVQNGAAPAAIALLDQYGRDCDAKYLSALRKTDEMLRSSGPAQRQSAAELRRLLRGDQGSPVRSDELPRHRLLQPRERHHACGPLFSQSWQVASLDNGVISDLLHTLAGGDPAAGPTTGPTSHDRLPALPEIDYDTALQSDPIVALATNAEDGLGGDPVRIFEFVRNECRYDPYFGVAKSASATLRDRAGSDADLSSLLIAMLRASGYAARYEFGTIELTVQDARAWVGIDDADQIEQLWLKTGIPYTVVHNADNVSGYQIDHVWVKAYLPDAPYRGVRTSTDPADTWIDLDPSFKQHTFTGRDVANIISLQPAMVRSSFASGNQVVPPGPSQPSHASGLNRTSLEGFFSANVGTLRTYLSSTGIRAEEVFRQRSVQTEYFGILPPTDQYRVVSRGMSFAKLPDSMRRFVDIRLDNPEGNDPLILHKPMSSLVGHDLVLGYVPIPGFEPNALAAQMPDGTFLAPMVRLQPQASLDGSPITLSSIPGSIRTGLRQNLSVTLTSPTLDDQLSTETVVAGSVSALVVDVGGYQSDGTRLASFDVDAAISAATATPGLDLSPAAYLGASLAAVGRSYLFQLNRLDSLVSGSLGVVAIRQPSVARVGWDLRSDTWPTDAPSQPMTVKADRVSVSMLQDVHAVIDVHTPTSQGDDPAKQFALTSAVLSKAVETNILQQGFMASTASAGTDGAVGTTASALQAFGRVNDAIPSGAHIPIYAFEPAGTLPSSVSQLTSQFPSSASCDVRSEVEGSLTSGGMEVVVPTQGAQVGAAAGALPWWPILKRKATTNDCELVCFCSDTSAGELRLTGSEVRVADLTTIDSAMPKPRALDLLLRATGSARTDQNHAYANIYHTIAAWLTTTPAATTNSALWYAPSIASANYWLSHRPDPDALTPLLSLLAFDVVTNYNVAAPGVYNVTARTGNLVHPDWIASAASGQPTGSNATKFYVSANFSRPSEWAMELYLQGQTAYSARLAGSGIGIDSQQYIDFAATGHPLDDGVYTYKLFVGAGAQTSAAGLEPVSSGTIFADRTVPVFSSSLSASSSGCSTVVGLLANVTEDHFASYSLTMRTYELGDVNHEHPRDTVIASGPDRPDGTFAQMASSTFWSNGTTAPDLTLAVQDRAGNTASSALAPPNPPFPVMNEADVTWPAGANAPFQDQAISVLSAKAQEDGTWQCLSSAELRIDHAPQGLTARMAQCQSPTPQTYACAQWDPINLSAYSRGSHTLYVRAVDRGGHASAEVSRTISFDPPIAAFAVVPAIATPETPTLVFGANLRGVSPNSPSWTFSIAPLEHQTIPSSFSPISASGEFSRAVTFDNQWSPGHYQAHLELTDVTGHPSADLEFRIAASSGMVAAIDNLVDPNQVRFGATSPIDSTPTSHALTTVTDTKFTLLGQAGGVEAGIPSLASLDGYEYQILFYSPASGVVDAANLDADPANLVPPRIPMSYASPVEGQPWAIAPFDPANDVDDSRFWTLVSVGDSFIEPGSPVAHLDLSSLTNGTYQVVLRVRRHFSTPGGGPQRVLGVARKFILDCPVRVGEFAFSQQDLVVPTGGFPLAVVRSYSSAKRAQSGPFGCGWTMAINGPQIQLDEGRIRQADDDNVQVSLRSGGWFDRDVTITLPDGRVATFAFELEEDGEANQNYAPNKPFYRAVYRSPPGVLAQLRTSETERLLAAPLDAAPPQWMSPNGGSGCPVELYEFSGWVLRMEDGTELAFDRPEVETSGHFFFNGAAYVSRTFGAPYLASITLPNHDLVRFDHDTDQKLASMHYEPALGSQGQTSPPGIAFAYGNPDHPELITEVFGPDALHVTQTSSGYQVTLLPNAAPSFKYVYDNDGAGDTHPRLITVRKTLEADNSGNPTRQQDTIFTYYAADPNDDSSLLANLRKPGTIPDRQCIVAFVRDPLGNVPLISEYDPDGRLVGTVDGQGQRTRIERDLTARTETVFDRQNHSTTYTYDARGNVTSEVDATGRTVTRDYQNDRVTREAVNGVVKRLRTYDDRGNIISETTPVNGSSGGSDGSLHGPTTTSSYSYDSTTGALQQVVSRDAAGVETTSTFDNGNLVQISTGSTRTINEYTGNNLTKIRVITDPVVDPMTDLESGKTTTFTYNDAGKIVKTDHFTNDPTTPSFTDYAGFDARGNQVYSATSAFASSDHAITGDQTKKLIVNWTQYDNADRPIATLRSDVPHITAYDGDLAAGTLNIGQLPSNSPPTRLTYTKYDPVGRAYETGNLIDHSGVTTFWDSRGDPIETIRWYGTDNSDNFLTPIVTPSDPTINAWQYPMVTLTEYDANGRAVVVSDATPITSTSPFPATSSLYPYIAVPVALFVNAIQTDYDYAGRAVHTTRLTNVTMSVAPDTYGLNPAAFTTGHSGGVSTWTTETHYDQQGRVDYAIDASMHRTSFVYNDCDQQIMVTDALGKSTTYQYDPVTGRRTAMTDALDNTTSYDYDSAGRLYKTTFADTTFVRDEFDGQGRRTAHVDQMGRRTEYAYDTLTGRLTEVTLPAVDFFKSPAGGSATTGRSQPVYHFEYTERGALSKVTDPNLHETTFAYDHFGRRTRKTLPGPISGSNGPTWKYVYDIDTGSLIDEYAAWLENPGPNEHQFETHAHSEYDPLFRRLQSQGSEAIGRPTVTHVYQYDLHQRRSSTLSTYALGNSAEIVLTSYQYDSLTGRTNFIGRVAGNTPVSTLTYGYDSADRLERISGYLTTAAGQPEYSLHYDYDALNRLSKVKTYSAAPSGGSSLPGCSPDRTYAYGYTDTGRIRSIGMPGGAYEWYEYDHVGHVASVSHTAESYIPLACDPSSGGPIAPTIPSNRLFDRFTYVRFPDGRVNQVTEERYRRSSPYGSTMRTVNYQYDDLGRMTEELATAGNPVGGPAAQDLPSLPSYKADYSFDLAGNRTRKVVSDSTNANVVHASATSSYNEMDQLIEQAQTCPNGNGALGYDPTAPTSPTDVSPASRTHYDYTSAGFIKATTTGYNTTSAKTVRADFTAEGKLWRTFNGTSGVSADTPSNGDLAAYYSYDGEGNLVGMQAGTPDLSVAAGLVQSSLLRDESYLVDTLNPTGYSQVLQEQRHFCSAQGFAGMDYVLGHAVLAQSGWNAAMPNASRTTQMLLHDGHGNTRTLTGATPSGATGFTDTGYAAQRFDYDAYGNTLGFNPDRTICQPASSFDVTNPLANKPAAQTAQLYCGERFDPSGGGVVGTGGGVTAGTGLYDLRARCYSSAQGRLSARDPVEGGPARILAMNGYGYCASDAVNAADPSGQMTLGEVLTVAFNQGRLAAIYAGPVGALYGYLKYGTLEAAAKGYLIAFWLAFGIGFVLSALTVVGGAMLMALAGSGVTAAEAQFVASIILTQPLRAAAFIALGTAINSGDPVDIMFASFGVVTSYGFLIVPNAMRGIQQPGARKFQIARNFKVRGVGSNNNEIDAWEPGVLVEEKTAHGLENSRNTHAPRQWAQKHIYRGTVSRIRTIREATSVMPDAGFEGHLPTIEQLQSTRVFHFEIESASPSLQEAVNAELLNLQRDYPGYSFTATFNGGG
jgi:RHS repeat-associated protein